VNEIAALWELLVAAARRAPDAPAVRTRMGAGWETWSWSRLHDAALAAAGRARALLDGQPLAIVVVDSSAAGVAGLFGLLLADVRVLLVERDSSYLLDERSAVRRAGAAAVVGPDGTPAPPPLRLIGLAELGAGAGPDGGGACAAGGDPDVLQLTSGSTGEPRIAVQSLGAVLRGGGIYRDRYRLSPADQVLVSVPLAHSFGLIGGMAAALVSGACLLTLTRFSLSGIQSGLDAGATVLLGTPMVYELVGSALPRSDGRALRAALSSGGALSQRTRERASASLGCAVHQIYGSTEMGLVASQFERASPWPEGCVGLAGPGVTWRLEPDDSGEEGGGRLLVRTSTMFRGYAGHVATAMLADGFYDTGDRARVDGAGHLYIDGRKDTFINVGGRKVNPERIERLIGEHPQVREVAVYGVEAGDAEEVHAAVVPAASLAIEDLLAWCRSRLSAYEVPHRVRLLEELPRTGLGKVDRRGLRAGIG
jgi:acyl-CoA synthetase (AMP-forming)/AMP-acid ligase II